MKRLLRIGVLCGALALLMCASVFAANVTEKGLYDLTKTDPVVTLTAGKGAGESFVPVTAATYKVSMSGTTLVKDGAGADYYPLAESIKVEVATSDTDQYLVIAQSDEEAPNKDNIVYIDQDTGVNSGTITFYVYPKALGKGTYYIYLASTNSAYTQVASFTSYIPYKLGDVDDNGKIQPKDALWTLQAANKKRVLTDTQKLAADADQNGKIQPKDALWILQASNKKRTL